MEIPSGKIVRFGREELEVWPERCVNGHRCTQCLLVGKIRCAPRFWISIPAPIVLTRSPRVERIKLLSLERKTPIQIARETGFPLGTVYSSRAWLKKKGIDIPQFPRERSPLLRNEIVSYVKQQPGLDYREVAQRFDVSRNYIAKIMLKHDYSKAELDTTVRLEETLKAARLMVEYPDRPLAHIARDLGVNPFTLRHRLDMLAGAIAPAKDKKGGRGIEPLPLLG